MYLSCTKGDLRLPSRGMPGFVLGINSQLVEIDSNCRLSRTVRNLASPSIVVTVLWNMMVRMNMELQYLLWLLLYAFKIDIPHVWHRIVANLEMDSYN